jgi:hypothetical protein
MGTAAPLLIKSQSCGHNRVLSSLAFASAFENPVNAQQANAAISHTRVIRVDATGIPTNSTHPRIPGLQGAESYASGGSEPPPPPAQVPHPNMATPHRRSWQCCVLDVRRLSLISERKLFLSDDLLMFKGDTVNNLDHDVFSGLATISH